MYYFQDEPDNALPYIGTLIFCHFTFSYSPVYNAQQIAKFNQMKIV